MLRHGSRVSQNRAVSAYPRSVLENVRNKLPLSFEDLGDQAVKNIAEPVRVFRVLLDGACTTQRNVGFRGTIGEVACFSEWAGDHRWDDRAVQHVSLKPPQRRPRFHPAEANAARCPTNRQLPCCPSSI